MKTITIIISLLLITISASSKPKPMCIGYWIVTHDTINGYKTIPTLDLSDVYDIADRFFPDNCIDFEKRLKTSLYIEIEIGEVSVYAEVRKVTYSGRLRKLNKREIKMYLK